MSYIRTAHSNKHTHAALSFVPCVFISCIFFHSSPCSTNVVRSKFESMAWLWRHWFFYIATLYGLYARIAYILIPSIRWPMRQSLGFHKLSTCHSPSQYITIIHFLFANSLYNSFLCFSVPSLLARWCWAVASQFDMPFCAVAVAHRYWCF